MVNVDENVEAVGLLVEGLDFLVFPNVKVLEVSEGVIGLLGTFELGTFLFFT